MSKADVIRDEKEATKRYEAADAPVVVTLTLNTDQVSAIWTCTPVPRPEVKVPAPKLMIALTPEQVYDAKKQLGIHAYIGPDGYLVETKAA